ncbi:tetratricopeptide repeat protein [Streptomyces sp. NPDC000888]
MEMLLRARELAVARKRRESRALVERAEPRSAEELSLAASVLVELRDPEAALPLARRAVELAPDDWRGHLAVADAAYQQRWWDESVAAARRAVALAPEEAAAHRALGVALNRRIGDGREARREVKRARELGGREALRMPGRRSVWWLLLLVPFVASMVMSNVGDRPDAVDALIGLSRVVLPAAFLVLTFTTPSRAGLTWPQRIAELRTANGKRYGDGGRAARLRAGVVVMPWSCAVAAGVGCLAAPGWSGNPLPTPAVVSAVLIGGGALAVLARRTVRLWYGERFLREVFLPSPFVRVHLVMAGALGGGVLLLTFGDVREGAWQVLFFWALTWFLLAMFSTLFLQRVRPAEPEKEPADG